MQVVCHGASPAKRSKHFWHDIGNQLPDHGRLALDQLRPLKGESSDVAIAKYDVMTAYLTEHGREFFGPGATNDWCAFHPNAECELSYRPDDDEDSGMICANHSGTMCTPFTQFGKRERWTDPHTESFLVWSTSQAFNGQDLTFLENAWQFPPAMFAEQMSANKEDPCRTVSIDSATEDFGVPVLRRRMLACAVRERSMAWLGPNSFEDIERDFL